MHGQFVWYELATPDIDAARNFYSRFTGWGAQPFDRDYTMLTSGGVPFAGAYTLKPEQRQQGITPNWMPYVETDDVDQTARLAASLGGAVTVGPQDIPGTGRFALLTDPQGAAFGIYKSTGALSPSWDGTPIVGRFSWHELMAADWQKAFAFYQRLFGWQKLQEMDMGGGSMYVVFGKHGKMYGGMFTRFGDMAGMHPFWLSYIHVKDVPKAFAAAVKAGAAVQRPPMDIPGGVIAILGDPQGAAFALHHAVAEPALEAAPRPAVKKAVRKPAKRAATKTARKATKKAGGKTAKKATTKAAARKSAAKKRPGRSAKRAASRSARSKAPARKKTSAAKRRK